MDGHVLSDCLDVELGVICDINSGAFWTYCLGLNISCLFDVVIGYADIRRGSLVRTQGLQMRVGWSKMAIFAYFTR